MQLIIYNRVKLFKGRRMIILLFIFKKASKKSLSRIVYSKIYKWKKLQSDDKHIESED